MSRTNLTGWSCALASRAAVFFAELGDKTQLAAMLFASQYQGPSKWTVFLAASAALTLSAAIGVPQAPWSANRSPPRT